MLVQVSKVMCKNLMPCDMTHDSWLSHDSNLDSNHICRCQIFLLVSVRKAVWQIIHDLLPDHSRAGIFYGLPKLHKLMQLIHSRLNDDSLRTPVNLSSISDIIAEATKLHIRLPYRPIVSCIGSITEHILAS